MEKEKPSMRRFSLWLGLGLVWVTLTYVICLMPPHKTPATFEIPYLDKLVHGLIYSFLMWWFLQIYSAHKVVLFITLLLMGISIELLQPLTGRSKELLDLLANSSGLVLGLLIWRSYRVRILHRQDRRVP